MKYLENLIYEGDCLGAFLLHEQVRQVHKRRYKHKLHSTQCAEEVEPASLDTDCPCQAHDPVKSAPKVVRHFNTPWTRRPYQRSEKLTVILNRKDRQISPQCHRNEEMEMKIMAHREDKRLVITEGEEVVLIIVNLRIIHNL